MKVWPYIWDKASHVWRNVTHRETPVVSIKDIEREVSWKGGAFRNPLGQFVSWEGIERETGLKRVLEHVNMTVQRIYARANPITSDPAENELIGVEVTLATPEGEFMTANIYAPRRGAMLDENFVNSKIAEWTKSKEVYTEYDVEIQPGLQVVDIKMHITRWEPL